MSAAGLNETQNIVAAMNEEEQKAAVKGIKSDVLVEELWSRLHFSEHINEAHKEIDRLHR